MTINNHIGLETYEWMVMATCLGSLICKTNKFAESSVIQLYDACWVVVRPEIWWADPDDLNKKYTESEAKMMGYSIQEYNPGPSGKEELDGCKIKFMIEVEGEMITEYIPIRPNEDILKTQINLNVSQIVYTHEVDNEEEIESYINQLMGRLPTRKL